MAPIFPRTFMKMTSPANLPFHKLFKLIHASQFPTAIDRDFVYEMVRWLIQNARTLRVTCVYDIYSTAHERTRKMLYSHFKRSHITMTKIDTALLQLYDIVGMDSDRYLENLQNLYFRDKEEDKVCQKPSQQDSDDDNDDDEEGDSVYEDDTDYANEDNHDEDNHNENNHDEDNGYDDDYDDDYEDEDDTDEDELMEVCLDTLATVHHIRALQDCQTRHMGWMVGMLCVSMTASLLAFFKSYEQDLSNLSQSILNTVRAYLP